VRKVFLEYADDESSTKLMQDCVGGSLMGTRWW
ncbi:hypothetical protein Tco_0754638, partial [Tanacetum coccineum]